MHAEFPCYLKAGFMHLQNEFHVIPKKWSFCMTSEPFLSISNNIFLRACFLLCACSNKTRCMQSVSRNELLQCATCLSLLGGYTSPRHGRQRLHTKLSCLYFKFILLSLLFLLLLFFIRLVLNNNKGKYRKIN